MRLENRRANFVFLLLLHNKLLENRTGSVASLKTSHLSAFVYNANFHCQLCNAALQRGTCLNCYFTRKSNSVRCLSTGITGLLRVVLKILSLSLTHTLFIFPSLVHLRLSGLSLRLATSLFPFSHVTVRSPTYIRSIKRKRGRWRGASS